MIRHAVSGIGGDDAEMTLLLLCWFSMTTHQQVSVKVKRAVKTDTTKALAYTGSKNNFNETTVTSPVSQKVQSVVFATVPKRELSPAIMVGGGLAITYGLFKSDDEMYESLHGVRMRSSVLSTVSPIVSFMGDGKFSIGLFGGFYLYHFVTGDESSLRAANLGMETFLFSGIATQILKNMFGRERPSKATKEGGRWSGPFSYFNHRDNGSRSIASYDAFPSGHTATIFAAATTIADSYPEKWVSYAAYSTATLVGVSRVMESAHWPSDVFVGAIIGYFSTKIVENLPFNRKNTSLQISVVNNSYGARLSFQF